MTPAQIEAYLHTHIPLSRAMGVRVVEAHDDAVVLEAPLAPNLNHRSTAFGGSLTTLCILAAWSWLHRFSRTRGLSSMLVIQKETMQFTAPAEDAFRARCEGLSLSNRSAFIATLRRYRRARVELECSLSAQGEEVGRFSGTFVALDAPPPRFEPGDASAISTLPARE